MNQIIEGTEINNQVLDLNPSNVRTEMKELFLSLLDAVDNSEASEHLDNNLNLCLKKYGGIIANVPKRLITGSEDDTQWEKLFLIRIKNVICNYKPKLHMGDIYVHITPIEGQGASYKFFQIEELNGNFMVKHAGHPHIRAGNPCFGSFQQPIADDLTGGHFLRWLTQIKLYLSAYYGRSVFERGSVFGNKIFKYQFLTYREIHTEFASNDNNTIDVASIARDSQRFNYPDGLTCWGPLKVSGRELHFAKDYMYNGVKFGYYKEECPYFRSNYNSAQRLENALRYDEEYSKLLGYVFAIMHYGELSFMQSLEFFRIFILTLDLQSKDELDVKKYEELKEIAAEVYNIGFDRWVIHTHTIRLTTEEEKEVRSLKTELDVYRPSNSRENDREFFTKLQSLGNVIGNFIVLIKRKTPYKAKLKKYCPNFVSGNIPEPINYKIRFNKVKKRAYEEALKKTENTKRRILNELRKPDIINIRNDDGQSELFSEDL